MDAEIAKVKKTRAVIRTSVTNLIKKAETCLALTELNFEELEEILVHLEQKQTDLKLEDNKIESLTKDLSEIEKEATSAMEYNNKIVLWKFRISKKLKLQNQTEFITVQNAQSLPLVQQSNTIKLPTLKIDKFYGDVTKFQDFWLSFKAAIHENASLSNIDKMNYLKAYLGGQANDAISGLALNDQTYMEAIDLLKSRFGKVDLIVSSHMNNLLSLKPIYRMNDISSLRKLYDFVQVQIRSIKSLDVETQSFDLLLLPIILKALPTELSLSFHKQCIKNSTDNKNPSVKELLDFIRIEIESREKQSFIYSQSISDSCSKQSSFPDRNKKLTPANLVSPPTYLKVNAVKESNCFFCCSDNHQASECTDMSIAEKKEKLKTAGRCFICLTPRHLAKFCRNRTLCKFCNGKHNSSLCFYHFKNESFSERKTVSNENSALTARISPDVLINLELSQKKNKFVDSLKTIEIECNGKLLNGVVDSGTQVSIIKTSKVPKCFQQPHGKITLKSAFGHSIIASLINVPLNKSANDKYIYKPVIITCAMVDNLINDLLLNLTAYDELREAKIDFASTENVLCTENVQIVNSELNTFSDSVVNNNKQNNKICNRLNDNDSNETNRVVIDSSDYEIPDSVKFVSEQKHDDSLAQCWIDAKNKRNNYFILDNLLYHKDKILGEPVNQLVIPNVRRKKLLELAHSTVWGGHLKKKKTSERIKYSFYWPKMERDVEDFCNSCVSCQLQAKKKPTDEIPITPVTRPNEPFQVINIDIIGPIEPSSRGYKYVLCVIDQCTRWPEAICLKNVSAKSTCDALLQIFTRTGIAKVIASDQGSNFTSALTREFIERIGSSPRFSVPGYPQSNGLVERWNGVLKNMIHHVMRENPSDWDKHLPYLLWAYREVPNQTTGVSPFQMLYGRRPSGPLSILKNSWTNETLVPLGQLKSVTEYLNDLKIKLELAAHQAGLSSSVKQSAYAFYHNRRKKYKHFEVGDVVIVLAPDSTHKMYARWTAPCTIIKKQSEHSYLVQLPDQSMKHIHANKIRPFKVQTANIGVIYEADIDFGDVENTPIAQKIKIDEVYLNDNLDISHLNEQQEQVIRKLLAKRPLLMSQEPKIANVGEHNIKLKSDSKPQRHHPYRIPEVLKEEVDRQIENLLKLGLIEQCESDYAHPVVCVAKKDGSVRLCIDFRSLNSVTEIDAFPMTNATDLIFRVSKSNFITSIDLLKGYWQIKMNESSKKFTSFVTHRGQYLFNVMPFGLRNAAATFQRTMNQVLANHRSYSETYIDDVVIFSDDWATHIEHLDSVLKTLEEANFTINIKKISFAKPQIKFLGHIVGSGTHSPDPEKVSAIQNLEVPKQKKDVKSVLGLLSYYRSYVPAFADIAHPLIELTKKRAPNVIAWNDKCDMAFKALKKAICNSPTCYAPNFQKPFIIYADASSYAVGACLAQKDENDYEHPVAFISKKLSKCQQRYATIEKEAYAVIFALNKFEHYIYGAQVTVVSDHNPLKFLTECTPQSARLQRWSLALQRFHAQICYRRGQLHTNADSLSRLYATHWT